MYCQFANYVLEVKYNTIQYNDLLTTPHGGFSVTIQLREITMVSKKTKISSKTLYYVCMNKFKTRTPLKGLI